MKRYAKWVSAVLILILLLGCLSACGGSLSDEEKAAVGKYQMTSIMGVPYGNEDSYLELKDNGKADLYVEGEGGTVKWSLEGGVLTLEDSESSFTGEVDGDTIQIDMEGVPTVFERV